ncbi:MAG: hypothetical protein AB8H79_22880 [Myxococcota bacterium]
MKSWMIWAAAAVLGIGLAAVLIPLSGIGTPPPTVPELPDATPITAPVVSDGGSTLTPALNPSALSPDTQVARDEPPPVLDGQAPVSGGGGGDDGKEDEEWVNDGRYDRAELLKRPDMVAVRSLSSRWRGIAFTIGGKDPDPAAANTMNRVKVLQQDLRAYRRNPEDKDFDALLKRQEHILGELKQTSYWGSDLQDLEDSVHETMETYKGGE